MTDTAYVALVPATIFTTALVSKLLPEKISKSKTYQRVLPLLPIIFAFALTFIPGMGFAALPIAAKIGTAFLAGGGSGWMHKVWKQTAKGQV